MPITRFGMVRLCVALFLGSTLVASSAWAQSGQMIYGVIPRANAIMRFSSTAPDQILGLFMVSGLLPGDTLKAIDFRPATGDLYAIAVDASNAQVRAYSINVSNGVATALGATATLPTPGQFWGMAFNAAVDRIRVVNEQGENARLNPNNGLLAGDDTNLSPGTPVVDAVAYTRPVGATAMTTLFALNQTTNSLATIGGPGGAPSPNGGVVTDIGPLGVTFGGSPTALDISSNGIAYAAVRPVGGAQGLYTVNLTTGAATLVGQIGDGNETISSIAVVEPSLSLSPGSGMYTTRQRFDLVMLIDAQGRSITGGTATFNNVDVTGILASCIIPGTTTDGPLTFRCPNLGGPVFGAPGAHTLTVTLTLSDGSAIQDSVTWSVLQVIEP